MVHLMSSTLPVCPACNGRLSERSAPKGDPVKCPHCGASVRPAPPPAEPETDDDTLPIAEPEEDAETHPARSGGRRRAARARKFERVAGVGVLLAIVGALWLAFGGGRGPAPERPDEEPAPETRAAWTPPKSPFADAAEVTPLPGAGAPVAAELADVIYLLPDDSPSSSQAGPDHFARELARQALWLAGREEFGLLVRDSALGDEAPAGLPPDRQFRLRQEAFNQTSFVVNVETATGPHTLWKGSLVGHGYPSQPARCVAGFEELSRAFYVRCLKATGRVPKPNRASDAAVPEVVEAALRDMREPAQVGALRALHEEVRARGESDALVGALVRGYANLGLLTEFHWGPAPFAFKARALLYAQRLVARAPGSAAALRLRAYAAALTGLHGLALTDLTALQMFGPADDPPDWFEAAAAYVRFDLDRLAAARARADTPLVRLLQFLAVEAPEAPAATIRAGRALLATDPDCYRAHDSLCRVGGISHLHRATVAGGRAFTGHLATRLGAVPGLPAAVREALAADEPEPGTYAALRRAGATDRGEPSWAALGGLLQEIRFTQAWHRLVFMADYWSVDARAEATELARPLEGHRLLPLIESYTFDPRVRPDEVRDRLVAAPVADVDTKGIGYYFRLVQVDPARAQAWLQRAQHGHGFLYPELARQVRAFAPTHPARAPLTFFLRQSSPRAPYARAMDAICNSIPAPQLGTVEAEYAGHPVVQWGLGERHATDGRWADAVRCQQRLVELSRSGNALLRLAELHQRAGDETRYVAALEASLKEEDTGLDHAQANFQLAQLFMGKGDFKRAEPYATAAAQSAAGWALVCAAECQEGLGNWDAANAYYMATAERYANGSFAWYLACRASGRMDRAGAVAAVRAHLERFGPGTTAADLFRTGRFHLLEGETARARELIDRANRLAPDALHLLFAALLADATGDAKARDAAFDTLSKIPGDPSGLASVGGTLRAWAGAVPEAAAVDAALARLPAASRPDAAFCFGWYLHNRNAKNRAVALWKVCSDAKDGALWVKTHARAQLHAAAPKRD